MKQAGLRILAFSTVSVCFLSGCNPAEPVADAPSVAQTQAPGRKLVAEGESYAAVCEKLGKPNIDSSTHTSRVLIYDEIEIKLQNDSVVAVYDHRKD